MVASQNSDSICIANFQGHQKLLVQFKIAKLINIETIENIIELSVVATQVSQIYNIQRLFPRSSIHGPHNLPWKDNLCLGTVINSQQKVG